MVSPIYLIAVALLVAFLLGIADRAGRGLSVGLTLGTLAFMLGLSAAWLAAQVSGSAPVEVLTAGFEPPFVINLRMGLAEAVVLTAVNGAFFGTGVVLARRLFREHMGAQVLLLMMAMGSNGLVLTRDLFNVFVFLEITAIATYGMIALEDDDRGLAAGFKYVIAGGLSSAFFLLGTIYLYRLTGTLNIDVMVAAASRSGVLLSGPGFAALFLVVAALLVELKPFPANGWALDVYQGSDPAVAATISVGTSGGILAALYKMTPMMPDNLLGALAGVGVLTFGISNLVGLRQEDARRMLGYSSVAQIGLIVAALSFARLQDWGGATTLLVAGGILVNHLLAKSGLFWLTGLRGLSLLRGVARRVRGRPAVLILSGVFVVALAGLPPFPTFWAKWVLVGQLLSAGQILWIVVVLAGSLFEAAYLFRFLGAGITPRVLSPALAELSGSDFSGSDATAVSEGDGGGASDPATRERSRPVAWVAPVASALALPILGLLSAWIFGFREILVVLPLFVGLALLSLDRLPAKAKGLLAVAAVLGYGWMVLPLLQGIAVAFLSLFVIGGAVTLIAVMNRQGPASGLVPLAATLVLGMVSLLAAESSLAFFLAFEVVTVSSYLLLLRRPAGARAALRYLMFSLGGAFLLMVGLLLLTGTSFAVPHDRAAPRVAGADRVLTPAAEELGILGGSAERTGISATLAGEGASSGEAASSGEGLVTGSGLAAGGGGAALAGLILVAIGFLVKAGAAGVHIWLPGAYAEAEDELSPIFSGLVSKVPVVGVFLLVALALAGSAAGSVDVGGAGLLLSLLGWIGGLTALFGALLAVFQQDVKYLLAYSSMSQLGYIVMAFVMGTQLGWTTGLYLSMLHLTFKVMLFLAVAGVVMRTGTRSMHELGGLIKRMPLTFVSALLAIIATSGVPPLAGFGGKWMLYTALLERGWYFQAALAFFASTIAFLYLFKFIHTIFLGQMKDVHRDVKEAPAWLLIPQFLMAGGIMAVSMYPDILLEPLLGATEAHLAAIPGVAAVNPPRAGATALEGYTVISTLGYWNGNLVMYVTMAVFLVPLVWLVTVMRRPQKVQQFNIVYAAERPERPETTHYAYNFFSHYNKALGFLSAPGVIVFWERASEAVASLGAAVRRLYSGNGQTYALHIVLFVAVLYLIAGGPA